MNEVNNHRISYEENIVVLTLTAIAKRGSVTEYPDSTYENGVTALIRAANRGEWKQQDSRPPSTKEARSQGGLTPEDSGGALHQHRQANWVLSAAPGTERHRAMVRARGREHGRSTLPKVCLLDRTGRQRGMLPLGYLCH